MKSLIITLLGSSLLLNSCTSFRPLEGERAGLYDPAADKKIRVTLVDNSEVEAEPYYHVKVSEPSDFVYGVGKIYMMQRSTDLPTGTPFAGRVPYSSIDSSQIITRGSDTLFVCWLSSQSPIDFDGAVYIDFDDAVYKASLSRLGAQFMSRIEFEEGDYLKVSADAGVGLWCVGTLKSKGEISDFAGRIPFEKIKEIEVRQPSAGKTALLTFGVLAGVVGITVIAIAAAMGSMSMNFGGFGFNMGGM